MQRCYEIQFFDRSNVKFLLKEWVGNDDLDALDEAQKLSTTHAVEVWEGHRRVARVNRANRPLRTTDKQSL